MIQEIKDKLSELGIDLNDYKVTEENVKKGEYNIEFIQLWPKSPPKSDTIITIWNSLYMILHFPEDRKFAVFKRGDESKSTLHEY